jgi:hypothetical protein
LVDPPFVNVPLPGEALSQDEVLARDQFSETVPALVNKKLSEFVVNGPPTHPVAVKPVAGVISRSTTIVKLQLADWPQESVALQLTVVVPIGNECPLDGTQLVVIGGRPPLTVTV